jgi:hypothetical protein
MPTQNKGKRARDLHLLVLRKKILERQSNRRLSNEENIEFDSKIERERGGKHSRRLSRKDNKVAISWLPSQEEGGNESGNRFEVNKER